MRSIGKYLSRLDSQRLTNLIQSQIKIVKELLRQREFIIQSVNGSVKIIKLRVGISKHFVKSVQSLFASNALLQISTEDTKFLDWRKQFKNRLNVLHPQSARKLNLLQRWFKMNLPISNRLKSFSKLRKNRILPRFSLYS